MPIAKRVLKLLASMAVFIADGLLAGAGRLIGRHRPARCVVLYYHGVRASERKAFARRMASLSQMAEVLPAGAPVPCRSGARYAMITFDDGFVSVLEHALPVLEDYALPATLFVPTAFIGQTAMWGRYADGQAADENESIVSAGQMAELKEHPLLTLGAHSVSHRPLADLADAEARDELTGSKSTLESVLGREIDLFSFPHGDFRQQHLEWACEAGYRRVFSIEPRLYSERRDGFLAGRFHASPSDWPIEFTLKVLGAYRWQSWLCRGRRGEKHSGGS